MNQLLIINQGGFGMKQQKEGNWFSRHKFLTVIIGFFVLVIIGSVASGGSQDTGSGNDNKSEAKKEPNSAKQDSTVVGLNQPARDGKFEFTVSAITCGQKVLGTNEYLKKEAQGEFCVLDVIIKNIGNEPQTLFADNQYVFNESGQKYSYASEAIMALEDVSNIWLKEINPGNAVNGKLPFDVPAGTKLVEAELHDSAFSSGVKVKLQ